MPTACMNESESSITKAWLAAIDASPMRATTLVKQANAVMPMHHWPPIGAPVRRKRAIAVRLGSPGPLLYVQERMGARGRRFRMFKFRSMRPDAEAASGPVWASEQDPRITHVGAFLRKYRLDELPQFVNVLLGDMALVGPRPERPHFCETLRHDVPLFDLRAVVRPGITGWAQVRAPYAAAHEEARTKLGYDLFYVSRRSPWFDLAILFETLGVALSGQGAR